MVRWTVSLFLLLALTAPSYAQDVAPKIDPPQPPVVVPPKPLAPKAKVTPLMPKGGDLLSIDASVGAGNVTFEHDFPSGGCQIDGKKLTAAIPAAQKQSTTFTVRITYWKEEAYERIVVTVQGTDAPPAPDPPVDPVLKAIADLDKKLVALDTRLAALEKPTPKPPDPAPPKPDPKPPAPAGGLTPEQLAKIAAANARIRSWASSIAAFTDVADALEILASPYGQLPPVPVPPPPVPPVPVDAFQAAVQAAYVADGKPAASAAVLASLYRVSGPLVNSPVNAKLSDVLGMMHGLAQTQLKEPDPTKASVLLNVRRAIADELNKTLGKTDKALDAPTRALISAQFQRAQQALEGVK